MTLCVKNRRSGSGCIPTPERGNDSQEGRARLFALRPTWACRATVKCRSPDGAACGAIRENVAKPGLRRKRLHPGYGFIVPTVSVGMPPVTLCVRNRQSGSVCIPTPERGNDKLMAVCSKLQWMRNVGTTNYSVFIF